MGEGPPLRVARRVQRRRLRQAITRGAGRDFRLRWTTLGHFGSLLDTLGRLGRFGTRRGREGARRSGAVRGACTLGHYLSLLVTRCQERDLRPKGSELRRGGRIRVSLSLSVNRVTLGHSRHSRSHSRRICRIRCRRTLARRLSTMGDFHLDTRFHYW
eukprot:4619303-Pyramimonas_sp.AAC.1